MPYIQRDADGNITGVFANPQPDATEYTTEHVEIPVPYQNLRATAYPPLSEFADAYYWLQNGDADKMAAYLQACADVKSAYPKPEETAP